MSLFRNRNNMERQLRKHLERLDYRPTDALWLKINNGLRGDFEQSLENRLQKFEATPDPELWEKIAAELPLEKAPYNYTRLVVLGFLLLLIPSTYLFLNYTGTAQLSDRKQTTWVGQDRLSGSEENHTGKLNKRTAVKHDSPANKKPGLTDEHQKASANAFLAPSVGRSSLAKDKNTKRGLTSSDIIKPELVELHTLSGKENERRESTPEKPVSKTSASLPVNTPLESTRPAEQVVQSTNELSAPPPSVSGSLNPDSSVLISGPVKKLSPALIAENTLSEKPSPSASGNNDDEKPTRFSITAMAGANYCFNRLTAPSGGSYNLSSNIALRRMLETPSVDWSGLFLLDYQLNDRLRISGGIGVLSFSQDFYYSITTPVKTPGSFESGAVYANPNDSIINGNKLSTRIKYSWTEIPIFINYRLTSNPRFNIEAQGGISYGILSTADAGMISYDNVGVLLIKDKMAFPGLLNSFFITVNPVATYKLNNLVTLGLSPSFKASLNSMINNPNWVQQYPYFIGLSASIRKRF